MTSARVTSATVKASTASSVETSTETRLPARREPTGDSSMIKTTEHAGMATRLGMRCRESMLRGYESMLRHGSMETRIPARTPPLKAASSMKSAALIEVRVRVIKSVVVGEDSAVGDIGVVVEDDSVAMPIISPVVPAPAIAAKETDAKEAFVIGGGQIYKEAMPIADKIVLTRVHTTVEGDAFFPEFSELEWQLFSKMDFQTDEKHAFAYSFEVWKKK